MYFDYVIPNISIVYLLLFYNLTTNSLTSITFKGRTLYLVPMLLGYLDDLVPNTSVVYLLSS